MSAATCGCGRFESQSRISLRSSGLRLLVLSRGLALVVPSLVFGLTPCQFVGCAINLEVYSLSTHKDLSTRGRILEETLRLISKRGGADVSMGEIAAAARLSRQAVYLHFRDRSDLLMALVRFVDVKSGIAEEVRKIAEAPTGTAGLKAMVRLQARTNPAI